MVTGVAVVGAGLAGLLAARAMASVGRSVVVVDEGDAVGGRLGSVRVGEAVADTGAQFFTVREPGFADLVDRWRAEGCPIREWSRGFAQADSIEDGPSLARSGEDGHPRYVVDGGMQALGEHLARDLDVRTGYHATAVDRRGSGWRLLGDTRQSIEAEAVVLAMPAPRAQALLIDPPDALRRIRYDPCIALVAALDRSPRLPPPGGIQFTGGPVRWLADNAAKWPSSRPAVTVHAAAQWSHAHAATGDGEVAALLGGLVQPWMRQAAFIEARVIRWPHAEPVAIHPQRVLVAGDGLVLAGDAFGGPRVEGAALSGLAAVDVLLS